MQIVLMGCKKSFRRVFYNILLKHLFIICMKCFNRDPLSIWPYYKMSIKIRFEFVFTCYRLMGFLTSGWLDL